MKRFVLPISHDAGISSYEQHAYINAMINNDSLMMLYIKDLNKQWIFDTKSKIAICKETRSPNVYSGSFCWGDIPQI